MLVPLDVWGSRATLTLPWRGGGSSPVACPSQEAWGTMGQRVSASLHPCSLPGAQGEGQASTREHCPIRPAFSSYLRMVSCLA